MDPLKKSVNKSLKSLSKMSPVKSLSAVKSSMSRNSIKNMDLSNIYKNNAMNNVALFILFALTIGYSMNKHYQALIFLYVFAVVAFLLCKNLFCALMITIILTNLLITVDFFKPKSNLEGMKKEKEDNKKEKMKKETKEELKEKLKNNFNFKNLEKQLENIKI
jgi:MFS superfamily sulfate permease-like transporter